MADPPTDPDELDDLTRVADAVRDGRFAEAVDRVARAADRDAAAVAGGPLGNAARILAAGGRPEHVARLSPARLNALVHTGWLASLIGGRPVTAAGDPLPWITYPAIDFLEPKVRPDWRVLEWGCGNSTRWWAARVRQVVGFEHDPGWHRMVAGTVPANATVHLAAGDAYADPAMLRGGEPFDVAVIDGEDRNRCARTAAARVRPTGLIVFDNSDRAAVRDGLTFLAAAGWRRVDFFGLIPAFAYRGCTSVFFKDVSLLDAGSLPCDARTSLGPSVAQVMGE